MSYPIIEEIYMAPDAAWCFEAFAPRPFSFFLDSGMDPQKLGRYSFMGSDPFLVMKSRGDEITLIRDGVEGKRRGNPFDVLGELLAKYSIENGESAIPFTGGAVGYFSYDLCHFIEKLPTKAIDDLNLPECYLGFYDAIVAFDHKENKTYLISTGFPEVEEDKRQRRAEVRLNELRNLVMFAPPPYIVKEAASKKRMALKGNFSHEGYLEAVAKAREYICAGDIFQVNLSQRLEVEINTAPYDLYKRLRKINPAPFASYFNFDGVSIVGASPERFLKVRGDWVETRPIKGTKPRGTTPEEDKALAESLQQSIKDRAENIMIVDLERNDIGRVCRYGTVEVNELMVIERYSHVMHICSNVTGRLSPGRTAFDALRATLPVGTVSGAPKVRAMQIIDEFETTRRGPYAGAVGYIDYAGNMDTCIALRTIVVHKGKAYVQAGGGIVADSVPEAEYEETLNKARALLRAIELAQSGFAD